MVLANCVSLCGQNPASALVSPPCRVCASPVEPEIFNSPPGPQSLKPDGTILAGNGIDPLYATHVSDDRIEMFLIPIHPGHPMIGPSVDGAYTYPLPSGQEFSVAFGVTSLNSRRITLDYDVSLEVRKGASSAVLSLVDGATTSSYIWTDGAAYNITDSAGNAPKTTVQNATRLRFLVTGGLMPVGSADPGISTWTLKAVNRHTLAEFEVDITVDTSV